MTYNKYPKGQKMNQVKTMMLAAGLSILVAACGQAEDTGTATSAATETAESQAQGTESAAPQQSADSSATTQSEGTWGDLVYGSPDAPVEVIEYASLTCPHCATFAATVFPQIKEKYIDTGKVRFVYRNFLLNQVDLAASTVARCGDEESTKKIMKTLFARQGVWLRAQNPLDGLAEQLRKFGMSRTQFDRCMSNRDMHVNLVQMTQDGQKKYQVNATPTIIVNGAKLDTTSFDKISESIDDAL